MRNCLLAIVILISVGANAQDSERDLSDAVKDYGSLQREIDQMLKQKCPDCQENTGTSKKVSLCSLKNICERPEVQKDGPVIYKNSAGEGLYSDNYYFIRDALNSCLKSKYADEIIAKKEELLQTLGALHLQKILSANKRLSVLVARNHQGAALSKVSAEILNMSLEAGISGESFDWELRGTPKDQMLAILALAEKKLGLKLNTDIKKTLVEIQYLKNNPDYEKEVEKLDRALIADFTPSDPLFDWAKLIDEEKAGGKKSLQQNIDHLKKKSQDAYTVFKEINKDMIGYLETKRTRQNFAMIDRMIERVKTIRFEPPRLTDTLKKHCSYPNAFYSSRNHSLTICPQMLGFPKAALMETLAHEMAHSFDSCSFSGKFYKKRGPTIVEDAPFDIDILMDPIAGNFQNTYDDDIRGTLLQDKVKYKDHPFSKTMSCLKSERSVGVVVIDESDILKKADAALAELKLKGQDGANNSEANYLRFLKANGKDYFDYFQGCDLSHNGGDTLLRSQMAEAFADKISSEIIARKFSSKSQGEAERAVIEIALSYGNVCSAEGKSVQMIRAFAKKEGCGNFFEGKTFEEKVIKGVAIASPEFDSHPKAEKRIERSLLAHPALRKALKCSYARGVKYCE